LARPKPMTAGLYARVSTHDQMIFRIIHNVQALALSRGGGGCWRYHEFRGRLGGAIFQKTQPCAAVQRSVYASETSALSDAQMQASSSDERLPHEEYRWSMQRARDHRGLAYCAARRRRCVRITDYAEVPGAHSPGSPGSPGFVTKCFQSISPRGRKLYAGKRGLPIRRR
jgi:hypothetical protein